MALSKEYYRDFSTDELAQDDYFIASVKTPERASELFWKEFLLSYPHKQEEWEAAATLVKSIRFRTDKPAAGAKEKIWDAIATQSTPVRVVNMKATRRAWIAAAAVLVLIASSLWLFTGVKEKENLVTAFGETRQVILPDQSVVTLNANSSIEYDKKWDGTATREVWLKGEAFFDVKHLHQQGAIKESDRFIVHVGNTAVEVLGTSFNVSDRSQVTKVVLQTGSVRVDFADKEIASIMMNPGEMMQYDQRAKKVKKETTQLEKHVAWKKKELLLNNTSMTEIISVIENTLGYSVEVNNDEIMSKQLSGAGTVSLEDEETLFRSLELILDVKIITKDKILYIESK